MRCVQGRYELLAIWQWRLINLERGLYVTSIGSSVAIEANTMHTGSTPARV